MGEVALLSIGRVEVEATLIGPDHVRVDVCGCTSGKGCWPDLDREAYGGLVELRYWRHRAVRFTAWTPFAHDLAMAINAACWRRIERKHRPQPTPNTEGGGTDGG